MRIAHPMTLLEEICKPHKPYHYILPRLQIFQYVDLEGLLIEILIFKVAFLFKSVSFKTIL